jgi:hypothetical protein
MRRAQGRLLVAPSARTIRWASLGVFLAVATLAVWSGARKGGDPAPVALPIATTLLVAWLCFLFEDAAAETTDATATPLMLRRAVRMAIAVPAVTAAWFALTWIGPLEGPTAIMTGSFVAETVLALAAGASLTKMIPGGRSGLAAAGLVVFVVLVVPVWLARPPSIDPARPPVGSPLTYWSTLAVCGCLALALAHGGRRA